MGTPHVDCAAGADPVGQVLQDFRAAIDREAAIAMDRLREIASTPPEGQRTRDGLDVKPTLISVGAAGHYADLSDDRIRALCRLHPYGSTPGGFGYRIGGRWQVVEDRFIQHIAARV